MAIVGGPNKYHRAEDLPAVCRLLPEVSFYPPTGTFGEYMKFFYRHPTRGPVFGEVYLIAANQTIVEAIEKAIA